MQRLQGSSRIRERNIKCLSEDFSLLQFFVVTSLLRRVCTPHKASVAHGLAVPLKQEVIAEHILIALEVSALFLTNAVAIT